MSEIDYLYHWKEVHPNSVKVDVRMLVGDGHIVQRNCYLAGTNSHSSIPEKRYVRYDKDYVIYRISQSLKPLAKLNHENFHELVDEAYMSLREEDDG